MEQQWNDTGKGKLKYSKKKTCPNVTLSTRNPTWSDLDVNLDHCIEKLVTNPS
jgi:hypothetical protein